MRTSHLAASIALLVGAAAIALGTDFYWKAAGVGVDVNWDTCSNWKYVGLPTTCYPANVQDNATFPPGGPPWAVRLTPIDEEGISCLIIRHSTTFSALSESTCLKIEKLTIDALGASAEIIVEVNSGSIGTYCLAGEP